MQDHNRTVSLVYVQTACLYVRGMFCTYCIYTLCANFHSYFVITGKRKLKNKIWWIIRFEVLIVVLRKIQVFLYMTEEYFIFGIGGYNLLLSNNVKMKMHETVIVLPVRYRHKT